MMCTRFVARAVALTRFWASWSVRCGTTFAAAAARTAELSAIALSVMLLLTEPALDPPDDAPLVGVGTRTRDVEAYDIGRQSMTIVGTRAPTRTQAATTARRRRKSHSTRPTSNVCSDN